MIDAGWELDTQGISHADLITLDPSQLKYQVDTARRILEQALRRAGQLVLLPVGPLRRDRDRRRSRRPASSGRRPSIPGWASPSEDPYRLPRLRVLGGTSPAALLDQISSAQSSGAPPASYGGAGTA